MLYISPTLSTVDVLDSLSVPGVDNDQDGDVDTTKWESVNYMCDWVGIA